ncbi:MAG: transposase [Frankiales bacterium]|nr:transposase [Frankiales bacterium]
MPKPFLAEFRRDVIAVARKGEASIAQIARDFGISKRAADVRLHARGQRVQGRHGGPQRGDRAQRSQLHHGVSDRREGRPDHLEVRGGATGEDRRSGTARVAGEPRLDRPQAQSPEPIGRGADERGTRQGRQDDDPAVAERLPHPTAVEQHLLRGGLVGDVDDHQVRRLRGVRRDPRRPRPRLHDLRDRPGVPVVHRDPEAAFQQPPRRRAPSRAQADDTHVLGPHVPPLFPRCRCRCLTRSATTSREEGVLRRSGPQEA